MNLKELIRAPKTEIAFSNWECGHIPKSIFPLSRTRDSKFKYGKAISWRLIKFKCADISVRVLLRLNEEKEYFYATLGIEVDGDMVVLCNHHFHNVEPGWHCHLSNKDHQNAYRGAEKHGLIKWPKREDPNQKFNVTKETAISKACKLFGIDTKGPLL